MEDLGTVVSRYNQTLDTYVDEQFSYIATDKHGRILFSHAEDAVTGSPLYSSVRIGDGDDLLDVLNIGDAVSGNTGLLVFGVDPSGDASTFNVDDDGNIIVTGTIDLDPTPGNDGDTHSDEAGANTEPGVIDSVGTSVWTDVVSIPIVSGEYVLRSIQCVADRTSQFRLIIDDNGTPTAYIGNWMITQNVASYEFAIRRGREISGAANRSLKLQAIRRAKGSTDANVSGRINGFSR